MKTEIKIRNEASVCTIDIEGTIGIPEEVQFSNSSHSVATYERLRNEVDKIKQIEAEEIIVNIRSTGGDVNDAMLIYEALSALNAKITTRCYGYTASAATIIAQAASEGHREIASSALYLVHKSSSAIEGNAADMAEIIDLLEKTDDRIASLYAARSSREKSSFEALMAQNGGHGRWLSPEEVIAAGLADAIIGAEDGQAQPKGVFAKVREWLSPSNKSQTAEMPTADINILHLPENAGTTISIIALEEGQRNTKKSETKMCEDPSLEGTTLSHNSLAYAEDIHSLKNRGL